MCSRCRHRAAAASARNEIRPDRSAAGSGRCGSRWLETSDVRPLLVGQCRERRVPAQFLLYFGRGKSEGRTEGRRVRAGRGQRLPRVGTRSPLSRLVIRLRKPLRQHTVRRKGVDSQQPRDLLFVVARCLGSNAANTGHAFGRAAFDLKPWIFRRHASSLAVAVKAVGADQQHDSGCNAVGPAVGTAGGLLVSCIGQRPFRGFFGWCRRTSRVRASGCRVRPGCRPADGGTARPASGRRC